MLRLNQRYPGERELVKTLAEAQRRQFEFDEALRTLENENPKTDADRLASLAEIMVVLAQQKRYAEVIERATVPLEEAHRLGGLREELSLLASLAQSHHNVGHLKESRALAERGMALAHSIGAARDEGTAVSLLVAIAMKENRYADAEALADRRMMGLMELGNESLANQMLITKSEILLVTERPREANELLTNDALPRLRATDDTYWEGYALLARAEVRRSLGRGTEAIEDCYAGEAIFRGLRSERAAGVCQDGLRTRPPRRRSNR